MAIVHERKNVVIMGAGAAGSLLAARLAAAGKSVTVLDAGPAWTLGDLVSSQIWARRLKWGGSLVLRGGDNPIGHNFGTGWGFGGSAIHHYAGWPRLQPADFRMQSEHGRGLDWPINYNDLRPHYDRIQAEVGLSGDTDKEVWRPAGDPYPMPPLKSFAQGRIIAAGFEKLGKRVAPSPFAVNSIEYKGRAACVYDGWCDAGCPIGALVNPLVVHIPEAKAAGAVFLANSPVTRILFDAKGRCDALAYRAEDGSEHIAPADLVVLAGAAVQNARVLLASGTREPGGLIGGYFNMHLIANAHGLFTEETECHMGLSAGTLTSQDDYGKARAGGPFGSITWGIAPAVKANDLLGIAATRPDLFGDALHDFMKRAARHIGLINGIVETIAQPTNRIELTTSRDGHGVPLARVVHSLAPESKALWDYASAQGLAVMRAAGATEAWATPQPLFSHFSGGTIMGKDAATSVTDGHGRLHAIPNLFAAGGGLFPAIGAVSPTFTVLALADRTASELVRNWSNYARNA